MIRKMMFFSLALCLAACSKPEVQAGRPAEDDPPPVLAEPDPELITIASRPASSAPGFLLDSYGLESGEIGVKECDALMRLMTECSRSLGPGGEALMADAKQQRLAWRLAAREAAGDPARVRAIVGECRAAEASMLAKMKTAGCPSASDRHTR